MKNNKREPTYSSWKIGTTGNVIKILRLHILLIRLSMVEIIEIGNDNWYRKSDCEHTSDGTQRSDNFSPNTDRPE